MRILAISLLVLAACPKTSDRARIAEAITKFRGFTDEVCACKDKACADKVSDDMAKWASTMASSSKEPKPSETEMKDMQELGTRFGECMTKLGSPPGTLPAPPAGAPKTADEILKQTFDQVGAATVTQLRFSYVREDGMLDPIYGTAAIHLGKPTRVKAADDPTRPIGAPVPVDPQEVDDVMARCPVYEWKAGVRSTGESSCMAFGTLVRPHCSVVEVWKQAIEDGAPAKGLAILELHPALGAGDTQSWRFEIDDAPRNIHIGKTVPDVCDPTLEKPVPMPPAPGAVQVKPNPY